MSVVELLKHPKVCKLLDSVTPPFPRQISAPIIMLPVTNRYSLVGTAFDYAIRFELERLNSHACTERWVSEVAVTCTWGIHRKRAQKILDAAKADFESYVKNPNLSIATRAAMAAHAIRLAKLDVIYRAGYTDPAMDIADPDDVQDILQLLAAAPYSTLAHPTTIYQTPRSDITPVWSAVQIATLSPATPSSISRSPRMPTLMLVTSGNFSATSSLPALRGRKTRRSRISSPSAYTSHGTRTCGHCPSKVSRTTHSSRR